VDWTDSSGTVSFRAFQCKWEEPAGHPVTSCRVDDAYVLVGGGAEIEGTPNPGALLIQSDPGSDLQTWWARSKDQVYSNPHRLRAYAIGMKLKKSDGSFMSRIQLKSQMYVRYTMSGTQEYPVGSADIQNAPEFQTGDLRLGGGAYALSPSYLQILIWSMPQNATGWIAASKDHIVAESGRIETAVIGIRHCPALYSGCLTATTFTSGNVAMGTGYGNALWTTSSPWATASIGANSSSSVGRLLTDILPIMSGQGGSSVWSKDHGVAASGTLASYIVAVKKE